MATGFTAGNQFKQRGGQHFIAKQQHYPVHRPHERRFTGAPAHAFGNGQLVERSLHKARQQLCYHGTGLHTGPEQEFALRFLNALQFGDWCTGRVGEGLRGTRGLAFLVVRGADRRALALHGLVGLLFRHGVDKHGQAAWRGVAVHGAMLNALCCQAGHDAFGEGAGEFRQRQRRQFFGADLDEEVTGAHGATPRSMGNPSFSRLW